MKTAVQRVLRTGGAILALLAATVLGAVIAKAISDGFPNVAKSAADQGYETGTLLAIAGFVLLVVKDLLLATKKTWSYIWDGKTSGASLGEASIWLIEAMVAVAIVCATFSSSQEPCPEKWKKCVTTADGLSRKCLLECMQYRHVDHFTTQITQAKDQILEDHKVVANVEALKGISTTPLLFHNVNRRSEDDVSENSFGIEPQLGHIEQLRRIAEVFKRACPHPKKVIIRVVGSSSMAPFRGETKKRSDELNLQAANIRAKVVKPALQDALTEARVEGVEIVAHEWGSFPEIRRSAFQGVDFSRPSGSRTSSPFCIRRSAEPVGMF